MTSGQAGPRQQLPASVQGWRAIPRDCGCTWRIDTRTWPATWRRTVTSALCKVHGHRSDHQEKAS